MDCFLYLRIHFESLTHNLQSVEMLSCNLSLLRVRHLDHSIAFPFEEDSDSQDISIYSCCRENGMLVQYVITMMIKYEVYQRE